MWKADRTAEAIDLLQQIARQFGTDAKTLRSNLRRTKYTAIRRMFCERGRALGLSTLELGIALNRDHTTVTYHANPQVRERKRINRPPWLTRIERRLQKMEQEQRHAKHMQTDTDLVSGIDRAHKAPWE